ncbi:iron transport multicopper oxidase FET3 [Xylogone sp. PMI_703]|nr:iron transport multicopper oxidase FET3 [Xylogone sp. PMI_703]
MFRLAGALFALISYTSAATITYNWSIDWVTVAPDGFSRQVIGINGQWPCPSIEASVGDIVVVQVTNNLGNQSTSLHFHGLDQKGTQVMDGPSGVTQCPIPPGSNYTYTFNIDRPGSYWYHSHNMGQYPDGLRGPLIVHDPNDPYKDQYDEELLLTVSDWYHDQVPVLIQSLLSTTNTEFRPPFPDAILLNDAPQVQFNFVPGKTYKIRVISMAAFASTLLQFDSHTMRVIEVDGTYIKKHDAYQIRVTPAQRYTFLLNAQPTARKNYAFLASLDINKDFANDAAPVYPLNITGSIIYDNSRPQPSPYVIRKWNPVNDATFRALDEQPLLGTPDKSITLDFNFGFDDRGIPRAYFNNITYITQKVPSLFTAFSTGSENVNPAIYGAVNPFVVEKGDIVQIVVNNLNDAIHPFHLHGHQFQVCERPSSGEGTYDGGTRNFQQIPMRRDVLSVNANSYGVIRFRADNPGVWLFHCHMEWHVIMGLMATIVEAPDELRGLSIPQDSLAACAIQDIPTAGNAAGNTANLTDLTGANTTPLYPNNG